MRLFYFKRYLLFCLKNRGFVSKIAQWGVQSNPQPSLRVFLLQQLLKIIFIFEKTNLTMRYLVTAFLLLGLSSYAQPTISKQVIGPGGQTFENGNNKLSYTVGEVAVGAMTDEDGSVQLGNGYYPSLDLSTLNTESPELQLQVKVYPNPVAEAIFVTHPTEQFFEVRISDVSGKQILQIAHQKPK